MSEQLKFDEFNSNFNGEFLPILDYIEVSTTQDGMVKIVENDTVKLIPPPGFVLRSV